MGVSFVPVDIVRASAIILGGVSFGMALSLFPQLKVRWAKEDLLGARLFLVVHFLVVLFVTGNLIERHGEDLTWRTPVALLIFSLKIVMLALLRDRIVGLNLR